MDLPPEQAALILAGAAFGPKIVTWAAARFVSKKDEAEKKIEEAAEKAKLLKEEREKEEARRLDERAAAMSGKLDRIETSINDLRSDAKEDRLRAAQLHGAVEKIEERIDHVSNNHRPRLEALEQKVAVLEAQAAEKAKRR